MTEALLKITPEDVRLTAWENSDGIIGNVQIVEVHGRSFVFRSQFAMRDESQADSLLNLFSGDLEKDARYKNHYVAKGLDFDLETSTFRSDNRVISIWEEFKQEVPEVFSEIVEGI